MSSIKRVFLITIDCLRADHVGCIGGGNLTPNIDNIAKKGVLFSRAFANGPATIQSFSSIFASTYFLNHGGLYLPRHFRTLAEVLEKEGFWTAAFHSNPFLTAYFGWNRGFKEYNELLEDVKIPTLSLVQGDWKAKAFHYLVQKNGGKWNKAFTSFLRKTYYFTQGYQIPYAEGKELNKHVIKWLLNKKNRKFFLWMHYMDPHEPFIPPENFLQDTGFQNRKEAYLYNIMCGLSPSLNQSEKLHELYKLEVKYVDECVGDLIKFLETHDMIDDSLFVILADHGQGFMEHGYFVHPPHSVYNELVHVPLIISGLEERRKINENVQLLDLAPTVLDRLGLKSPPEFLGISLFNIERDACQERNIFIESAKSDMNNLKFDLNNKVLACVNKNMKLIKNDVINTIEMYNLEKDFNEEKNIVNIQIDKYHKLNKIIEEHAKIVERFRKSTLITKHFN